MAEEQPVVQEVTPAVAADTQQEGESANNGNSEQTATSDATAEEGSDRRLLCWTTLVLGKPKPQIRRKTHWVTNSMIC